MRCHCARTGARTQRSSKGDEYQRGCNGDGSCTRGRMVKASRAVVVTLHCSTTWSFLLKYFLFFPYRYDSRKTTEKIISIKIILRCSLLDLISDFFQTPFESDHGSRDYYNVISETLDPPLLNTLFFSMLRRNPQLNGRKPRSKWPWCQSCPFVPLLAFTIKKKLSFKKTCLIFSENSLWASGIADWGS